MPLEKSYGTLARMARKQVIVQLDDRLVAQLDEEAAATGVSRSEILRRACREYLSDADERRKEREMVEAYRRTPQDPDEFAALNRLAAETAPPW
jgi:metal-responsive CopG/Arc/MetJ family transcriptional regulator